MNKRDLKKLIKRILSPIMCKIHGLKTEGKGVYIGWGCKFIRPSQIIVKDLAEFNPYSMVGCVGASSKLEIGTKTRISMFSRVSVSGYVKLGNEIEMGPHVFISDHNHEYRDVSKSILVQGIYPPPFETTPDSPTLEIGDGCWLGTNVVVVGQLRIGKHCVIGANSIVNKDIPDYSVAVGIPAKVIKRYDFMKRKWVNVSEDC